MTQDNSSKDTQGAQSGSDRFNTIAGWVLFAGILGLGGSILAGKVFHGDTPQRPETLGYVIETPDEEEGPGEISFAEALNTEGVSVAAGEKVFAKCQACHSIAQGGANGIGPNLYGVMGAAIGQHAPGFGYSSALASKGGSWGWEEMNLWLENPRGYVDGTSMGFAGLSSIEDRASVALYLNSMGSSLAVPEYTAPAETEEGENIGELEEEARAEAAGEAIVEQNESMMTAESAASANALDDGL